MDEKILENYHNAEVEVNEGHADEAEIAAALAEIGPERAESDEDRSGE